MGEESTGRGGGASLLGEKRARFWSDAFWRIGVTLTLQDIEFLSHYIAESDAIEQIMRSPDEALRQIKIGRKRGHVGAYGHLLLAQMNGELISEEMILRVQGLIVAEQPAYGQRKLPKQWVGQWRNVGVSVGGRNCPHSSTVPESMEHLVRRLHAWQKHGWVMLSPQENVRFIARAHFDYLTIHPFADGNGRSSRVPRGYRNIAGARRQGARGTAVRGARLPDRRSIGSTFRNDLLP